MKIEAVANSGGGAVNFVVSATEPTEVALLKQFTDYRGAAERQRLFLHSDGGRSDGTEEHFCFGWRREADFARPSLWQRMRRKLLP